MMKNGLLNVGLKFPLAISDKSEVVAVCFGVWCLMVFSRTKQMRRPVIFVFE